VGNLPEEITEPELRDQFYQFGEIRSIALVPRQQCAFVQYTKRNAAELAAERTFNKLVIQGRKVSIKWAHSQAKQSTVAKTDRRFDVAGIPPPSAKPNDYFNLRQEQINVMPAGMKLHQLPSNLVPASAYQLYSQPTYAAPYGNASTTAASSSSVSLDSISVPQPPGQVPYPSQDASRMGAVKK